MATPGMLINLFPALSVLLRVGVVAGLGIGALVVFGSAANRGLRLRRREAVAALARTRGMSEPAATFLGRVFQREGPDTAAFQLANPDLLRSQLGRIIARRRNGDDAARFAEEAGALLGELGMRKPAFEGAPQPLDRIVLRDAADPTAQSLAAWVLSADERNLTLVSRQPCPWPVRRSLLVSPVAGGDPFSAALLLRPVPPSFEWVLTHDLVDVITNRRSAVRVACRLHTFCLPESGDPLLQRERLQHDETLDIEALRRSRGWSQRHGVTVLDLSADGALLAVEHEVSLHERLLLVLTNPEGALVGLPLAEIVSLSHADDGGVHVGTRFVGVRLKERLRLAGLVRSLASRSAAGR